MENGEAEVGEVGFSLLTFLAFGRRTMGFFPFLRVWLSVGFFSLLTCLAFGGRTMGSLLTWALQLVRVDDGLFTFDGFGFPFMSTKYFASYS